MKRYLIAGVSCLVTHFLVVFALAGLGGVGQRELVVAAVIALAVGAAVFWRLTLAAREAARDDTQTVAPAAPEARA